MLRPDKFRFRQASGLAALVSVAISSTAVAQQLTPESMARQPQKSITNIKLKGTVEYDSNVADSGKALAMTRGLTLEDITYTPALTVDVIKPLGRQALFLNGMVGYIFHDKNRKLDSERIELTGGIGNKFGPCGTILSAGYARGRTRIDDFATLATPTNTLEVERANFAVTCARQTGFGVQMTAMGERGQNSEPLILVSDYRTVGATAGLLYGRPSAGTVTLIAGISHIEYPNRPKGVGQDGFDVSNIGLQLERRLGSRIQATVSGAYTRIDALSQPPAGTGRSADFAGTTYTGKVNYRASGRLSGSVEFSRSIRPTQVATSTYEVQEAAKVEALYKVGQRILVRLSGSQTNIDTGGTLSTPSAFNLTNSKLRVANLSMTYTSSKRLQFILDAEHAKRRTNLPAFDYVSDRVGLTTALAF